MTAATYAQSAVVGEDHGPRLGERGAAWQQCLVSAALFVPIVAWWPMSLWLYQFDPHHGESGPARVAAFNADGPNASLILRWALTAIIVVYFVAVIVWWARSPRRAVIAAPIAAVGAIGFWGGQVPLLLSAQDNLVIDAAKHAAIFVALMIVAWSIARRRHPWWLLGVPIIAVLAVNASRHPEWFPNPTDVVLERTADGIQSAANPPFWPITRQTFGDVADLIAGILLLWAIDAGFGAIVSRGTASAPSAA